jgi:hypothetical protein
VNESSMATLELTHSGPKILPTNRNFERHPALGELIS